jgi:hypothetical protein
MAAGEKGKKGPKDDHEHEHEGSPSFLNRTRYRARPRPRSSMVPGEKGKRGGKTITTRARIGGIPLSSPLEALDGHRLITLILGVDRLELCDFRPLLARLGLIPHDIQRLGILGVMDNSLGR